MQSASSGTLRRFLASACVYGLTALATLLTVTSCGGGDSGAIDAGLDSPGDTVPIQSALPSRLAPPAARTIVGVIETDVPSTSVLPAQVEAATLIATTMPQSGGSFVVTGVPDGDHSLSVTVTGSPPVMIFVRMLDGRGLNLGVVQAENGRAVHISGFDGYRFGFFDGDGDGRNDLFRDANGDGICDEGMEYAGTPYFMDMGYADYDGDGVNDLYADADGDGRDDHARGHLGHGVGWFDLDGDRRNDFFADADGDGICDLTGMPFRHGHGYADEAPFDHMNDRFVDADGDGHNDRTGRSYVLTPGWVDLTSSGHNDFFRDADGDGINDVSGIPYAHGFGWRDVDDDGNNDLFRDADGDGIVDPEAHRHAGMTYAHRPAGQHVDAEGDGIDDATAMPFAHGFGWLDADGDHINDLFLDRDGDGINDLTGHGYHRGYGHEGPMTPHPHEPVSWPMEPGGGAHGGHGHGQHRGTGR